MQVHFGNSPSNTPYGYSRAKALADLALNSYDSAFETSSIPSGRDEEAVAASLGFYFQAQQSQAQAISALATDVQAIKHALNIQA